MGGTRKNSKERRCDRVSKEFTDGVKLHPIFSELLRGHEQVSHSDSLEVPATSIITVEVENRINRFP